MAILKVFYGNSEEIRDIFRVSKEGNSGETFVNKIKSDLGRAAYVSCDTSIENIKASFWRAALHNNSEFNYTPGAAIGGRFVDHIVNNIPPSHSVIDNYIQDNASNPPDDIIRIAYIDDNQIHCSFSLGFLRNIKSGSPIEKQKLKVIAEVVRDTPYPDKNQTVTFIVHPDLLSRESKKVGEICSNADDEIQNALNSKCINELVNGLIRGDSLVSYERFKTLQDRLRPNQNIDNRDEKKLRLDNLMNQLKGSLDKFSLKFLENKISNRIIWDMNYFKKGCFEKQLSLLFHSVERLLKAATPEEKARITKAQCQLLASTISDENIQKRIIQAPLQWQEELVKEISQLSDEHEEKKNALQQAASKHPLSPIHMEQSFLRRNLRALTILVLSLTLAVGIGLCLTGGLAPLGIPIVTGIVMQILSGLGISAGGGALLTSVMLGLNAIEGASFNRMNESKTLLNRLEEQFAEKFRTILTSKPSDLTATSQSPLDLAEPSLRVESEQPKHYSSRNTALMFSSTMQETTVENSSEKCNLYRA